jgi:hypothetical protein
MGFGRHASAIPGRSLADLLAAEQLRRSSLEAVAISLGRGANQKNRSS